MAQQSVCDRNRGAIIATFYRKNDQGKEVGSPRKIFTYPDDPGIYYHANGDRATDDEARAAMFDVELDKQRREAVNARNSAEKEYAKAKTRIDEKAKSKVEAKKGDVGPRESKNLRIKHRGGKLYNVLSKETGEPINSSGMSLDDAIAMLEEDDRQATQPAVGATG